MLSAHIFGGNENIGKVAGKSFAYDSCAEAKNICVVMLACQACRVGIGTARRTNPRMFVCRDRHTYAGTADKYPALKVTELYPLAERIGKDRIITALGRVGPDIRDRDPLIFKMLDHLQLKLIARVIRAYNDSVYHIKNSSVYFPRFSREPDSRSSLIRSA